MKRVLLVNFAECPENLHFERALGRCAARRGGLALDVLHDFDYHYDFLGAPQPPGGRRVKYSGPASLAGLRPRYDLVLLTDFPKRARCSALFLRLAGGALGRTVFVANHLSPMKGDNFTADLARRLGSLSGVPAGYILESDDKGLWAGTGLAPARVRKRGYAVDCAYYAPQRLPPGDYVFSAGSAGREFGALAAGARRAGLGLKIFSDSGPGGGLRGAEFLPLAKNLHNLRSAAAGARAVAIPLKDGYINQAGGNSIAFLSMAMGKPVLTRRTWYMEHFIRDGVNGFFYDKLSPASVEAGLRRILALSPAALEKLSANARKTILQKASLDRFCAALLRRFFKDL